MCQSRRWAIAVSASLMLAYARPSTAVDVFWNVAGPADWNTAGNWNPARVPGSNNDPTDNATFNNGGTSNYSTNVTNTFGDIRFADGSNSGGTVNQSAGTINGSWLRMDISGVASATYNLSGGTANFARVNVNEGAGNGNANLNVQGGTLSIPQSSAGQGTGALFIYSGIGGPLIGDGIVKVSSGALSVGGDLNGNQSIVVGAGNGINISQLNVSGTGSVAVTGGADMNVGGGSQGAVNQSGGAVNLFTNPNAGGGWLAVGRGASGSYTLSGGSLTTTHATNDLVLGNSNTFAVGEFDLDGGTATIGGAIYAFGESYFNFNGGTLRPGAGQNAMDHPSFMSGLTTANVRNGGAIIDTNGHDVTIAQPLIHSTIGGDNPTDGGLTKVGAGTLTLTSIPTYTGNTVVSAGTLTYSLGLAGYSFPTFSSNSIKGAGSVFQVLGGGPLTIQGGGIGSTGVQVSGGGQIAYTGWLNMLNNSSLTIDGDGSGVFGGMSSNCTIGVQSSIFPTPSVVTVSNNGVFKATGFGSTYLNPTGTININGGVVDLSILVANGGTINFSSGSLSFLGSLRVGVGGLLGDNLLLDNSKILTLDGTTTIDQFETLALYGGTLSTGNLVNNGTFSFTSGTLNLTGSGGLTIDSGGALGNVVTVGAGSNLNVTGPTILSSATANLTVNGGSFSTKNYLQSFGLVTTNGSFAVAQQVLNYSGATIDVTGGSFSALSFNNFGSLLLDGGTISIGALGLTNNTGAYFYIGQNKTATVSGTSLNAGEIQLGGASALLTGAGALSNVGLLHGDGVIAIPVVNSPGGEIRAEAGKRIKFSGSSANIGKINLQGGTAEFSQPLTNGGQINGQGNLIVPVGSNTGIGANQSSVFGLTDNGTIQFSGGNTNVYGSVNLPATYNGGTITGPGTGKVLIGGGGNTVSFYGDVWNNGSQFSIFSGSYAVFFGIVHGATSFSGGGTPDFEGIHQVGNSPAVVGIGGNVIYGTAARLDINIGGTIPGNAANNYAQLNVAGTANLAGTLNLIPYNGFVPVSGDKFQVMTYASETGTFSSVTGTSPAPGLTYSAVYEPTSLVILTTTNGDKTWGVDASGNSSLSSNWIGGVAPGGIGDSATFSTIITAPRVVALDADTTVGALKFDSPISYTIAGPKTLTLQAAGSSAATINVLNTHGNGAHTISAPITAASDLNIAQNSSGTLRIAGPLNDSAAHSINKSGAGVVEIDSPPTFGANANINVTGGTLRFALASGPATVGAGVQAVVAGSATLELAGAATALSSGPSRANVLNSGSAAFGLLVSGTNQQVGFIDGSGVTQVNAGSDLTANHIVQSVLVIGGMATSNGFATIAASDASGNPLGQTLNEPSAAELSPLLQAAFLLAGRATSFSQLRSSDQFFDSDQRQVAAGDLTPGGNSSVVPEPTTLVMAVVGLLSLVIFARRHRGTYRALVGATSRVAIGFCQMRT